jgi:hypothetical protein
MEDRSKGIDGSKSSSGLSLILKDFELYKSELLDRFPQNGTSYRNQTVHYDVTWGQIHILRSSTYKLYVFGKCSLES